MLSQDPTDLPIPFILYRSRKKIIQGLVFLLFMFLCSLWALWLALNGELEPIRSVKGLLTYVAVYAGSPAMLVAVGLYIHQNSRRGPILVVDEQGITCDFNGLGLIPWSDIAGLGVASLGLGKFLIVVPRDVESFVSRFTGYKQTTLRHNVRNLGGLAVPEQFIPMKATAFVAQVQPYANKKIAEHAPQTEAPPVMA